MSNFTDAVKHLDSFVQMHEPLQYVKDVLANLGDIEDQAKEAATMKVALTAEIEGYKVSVEKIKKDVKAAQEHFIATKEQEAKASAAAKLDAQGIKQRAKDEVDLLRKDTAAELKAMLAAAQVKVDEALAEAADAEKRTTLAMTLHTDVVEKINKIKASF